MDDFVSNYVNRLDSKGRVSIPASYRQILAREGQDTLFCSPSLEENAIDAGGLRLRGAIDEFLEAFDVFSEEREILSSVLLGQGESFKIDKDGRVVLSETIKTHAGITDAVVFVGTGFKFRIWSPEGFEAYREKNLQRLPGLLKDAAALRRRRPANAAGGGNA